VHPTVLVVDDNDDTRDALTRFFRAEGYGVATARNGREGLAVMRETKPCIILLDVQMADMSGYDFREAQLADDECREIPVVVFSAAGDIQEAAERMGASAIAQKPIELRQLKALVVRHCLR
jgi:CheY-like chemotaxis protein